MKVKEKEINWDAALARERADWIEAHGPFPIFNRKEDSAWLRRLADAIEAKKK